MSDRPVGSLQHEPRVVGSFDGTRLAVRVIGVEGGTPILVVSAVGVGLTIWRRALPYLVPDRVVIAWDMRGFFASGPPATPRLDPGTHAEDAIAALDAAEVDRCVVAGWSNGTRIALEIAARYPERVAGLALICGAAGRSAVRAVTRFEPLALLPTWAGIAKHFPTPFAAVLGSVASRLEIAALIRHSGLVAPTADVGALADLLRGFASCDPKRLLHTYEEVAGSYAPGLLRSTQCPALVVAGDRDPFATRPLMQEAAAWLPDVRFVDYEGASHYLPLEFPARLADDLAALAE